MIITYLQRLQRLLAAVRLECLLRHLAEHHVEREVNGVAVIVRIMKHNATIASDLYRNELKMH